MTTKTTARPVDVAHSTAVQALTTARETVEQADAAHTDAVTALASLQEAIASADEDDAAPGSLAASRDLVEYHRLRAVSASRKLGLAEQAERQARAEVLVEDTRGIDPGDQTLKDLVATAGTALADLLDHVTTRHSLVGQAAQRIEAVEQELTAAGQPTLKRSHAVAQTGARPVVYLRPTGSEPGRRLLACTHIDALKAVIDLAVTSAGGTDRLIGHHPGVLDDFGQGHARLLGDLAAPVVIASKMDPEAARQARIANAQTGR